jgi:multiple antibiotic resistance protein
MKQGRNAAGRVAIAFGERGPMLPGMLDLAERFLRAFIPLFVAIDPIGLAAIFLALGHGVPAATRKKIASQATLTGGAVALLFLFLGQSIFAALGITSGDFQIAGGLILFMLAARELVQSAAEEPPKLADDFGVVPLGMPLIAGPASITTLILLAQTVGVKWTLVALAANLVLIVLAFAGSEWLGRLIGVTGLRAVSKIVSLLLAAIAVNMIRHGLRG